VVIDHLLYPADMSRRDSDEQYVMDLCDQVLGTHGLRQHRFDWLLGDPGKRGNRVRLPIDGYWPEHALVIEYRERQHDQPTPHFDHPERLTVSGVHRGIQRAIYDKRREELVPLHGLRLVIIKPSDLDANTNGRLRRSIREDAAALEGLLAF
jgi:hypothetical protein